MIPSTEALLALTLLSALLSLTSHRLITLIYTMAFQGILISLVPIFYEHHEAMSIGSVFILIAMLLIKGFFIPGLMLAAVKRVKIRREVVPIIGYNASLFIGLIFIMASAFIADRIAGSLSSDNSTLIIITAITTLASGLFLLMNRYKAITQVVGYMMMENGIYLFGTALAKQTHTQYIVEFGVLLDILVGVMVMGIVLNNINTNFNNIDTDQLQYLKD